MCVYCSWTPTPKVDSPRHFPSAAGKSNYLLLALSTLCKYIKAYLKWFIGKQIKEQTDVKASLDGAVKSILEELTKSPNQEKLQKIALMLTAIPEQLETSLQKIQSEICHKLTGEIQVMWSFFFVYLISRVYIRFDVMIFKFGQSLTSRTHAVL